MGCGAGNGSGGSKYKGISLIIVSLFRLFRCDGESFELFFAKDADFDFFADDVVS